MVGGIGIIKPCLGKQLTMCYKSKVVFVIVMLFCYCTNSQTKTSVASGNWSDPTKWSPSGVPSSTNNVIIDAGHSILLDVSASCNSLTIGSGAGNSHLVFSGNTALSFTVNSDIQISSSCSFSILSTSNTTHSLIVNGDILNNGSIRLYQDANSLCDVVFVKNGNQSLSGSGILTRFNLIHLNMGTSINNVLEISTPSFSVANNFLTLSNGTFKLSSAGSFNIEPFRFFTTIPASAGFWLNSPLVNASTNAGIGLNGKVTVSAGQLAIGNGQNEDLEITGGTLTVNGGSLNVAGKCYAVTAPSAVDISAGVLRCPTIGSTNTTISPVQITASGSSLTMGGGRLVIEREGGNGNQDLGLNFSSLIVPSISNGTIQIGSSNSPVNQTILLNSGVVLPSLEVNSANVTSKVVNQNLNILSSVSILSGTLLSNGFNLTLGGDWLNLGSFNPSTALVTFSSNVSQMLYGSSSTQTFNALQLIGSGTKVFSTSVLCVDNFSVGSGTTVDLSNSSNTITLNKNFFNDGNIQPGNSQILFNSTSSQTCAGASVTNFHDLVIQNSSGVVFNTHGKLDGTLTLRSGTLQLNGTTLTLVSNSVTTGRIAEITGTGDILGTVVVERFIPGGSTGWVLLGTPISSTLTLNDWDDDISISCPTCPDGYVSNFSSIFSYDETVSGTYDASNAYVPLSGINDPISPTKGYWVYLGDGPLTTNDITIDVSGAIRKFSHSIPLNYTNHGSVFDDGWNLICNPYPSSISWTALKGTTSNVDNAIYIYNPDLASGSGAYASYVNGISSPAIGSGGIGDNIAMCQGFYVHSTGATSLNAQESNKVAANQTFLKSGNEPNRLMLRLGLIKDSSVVDETVLYFQEGAHHYFDGQFDAFKMRSSDPFAAVLSISDGFSDFQINGVAPFENYFSIWLKAVTGNSGNYKIKITDKQNIPYGMCIHLLDRANLTITDLLKEDLSFYLPDTTIWPRFELVLKLSELNIASSLIQPSCDFPDKGSISAKANNTGPWNYLWQKDGKIVKETRVTNSQDSISNLSEGTFKLEVNTDGLCDNNTSYYKIERKIPVKASFISPDTLILKDSTGVRFTNTSINSKTNNWYTDFNGQTSNELSPRFIYSSPGRFKVKLISESATACLDSMERTITVLDTMRYDTSATLLSNVVLKNMGNRQFKVEGLLNEPEDAILRVFSIDGKEIFTYKQTQDIYVNIPFVIQDGYNGLFIVCLTCKESVWYWKIIVD